MAKDKDTNLGSGDPATVEGNTVEVVTEFRHLGSIQSSSGRYIGVASSAMHGDNRD